MQNAFYISYTFLQVESLYDEYKKELMHTFFSEMQVLKIEFRHVY